MHQIGQLPIKVNWTDPAGKHVLLPSSRATFERGYETRKCCMDETSNLPPSNKNNLLFSLGRTLPMRSTGSILIRVITPRINPHSKAIGRDLEYAIMSLKFALSPAVVKIPDLQLEKKRSGFDKYNQGRRASVRVAQSVGRWAKIPLNLIFFRQKKRSRLNGTAMTKGTTS